MDPREPGFRHHGFADSSVHLLPFFGTFLLLVLLAALTMLYLSRQGKLNLPGLRGPRSPEDEAKRILAERFARGDIDTDDFMERASILNWTPGTDSLPSRPGRKRR